jgi:hypothetical protein
MKRIDLVDRAKNIILLPSRSGSSSIASSTR